MKSVLEGLLEYDNVTRSRRDLDMDMFRGKTIKIPGEDGYLFVKEKE